MPDPAARRNMTLPLSDVEGGPAKRFWEVAQREELCLPRCADCGRFDWYPSGLCRSRESVAIGWARLSGAAELFSWSVVHRALDVRLTPLTPYVSVIVTLVEDPASRFVSRMVDTPTGMLSAGMPLAVRFHDLGYPVLTTGTCAPLFTAVGQTAKAPIL